MGPKGYPACLFFFFVIAVSFLSMGRVAFRALDSARSSPSSIENSRPRASDTGLGAETPRLANLTAGLKPRPPGLSVALGSIATLGPILSQNNCKTSTSAAKAARGCEVSVVAQAATYKDTKSRAHASEPPNSQLHTSTPVTYRAAAGTVAANFSLPITFEPAAEAAGQAVQYVGQGKGMTVLLDSSGIGISVGSASGANATPGGLKLRLVKGGTASDETSVARTDGDPSRPPAHRKRRPSTTPRPKQKPRTRRNRDRQNMPRKDAPGHKGQTPRPQRAPQQRLPRQTKPTGSLETPSPSLANTETNFAWHGLTALSGESNYFLGSDPAKWRTHVPHFAAAEAKDVLPGVDILAYGNNEGVEYDLRLAPGVDPNALRLEIANAGAALSRDLQLDASGDLLVKFAGREMRMKKPAIYEEWAADTTHPLRRKQIDGGYEIAADGRVAFHVGPHDPRATLVLDPSLTVVYATFLGGTGNDTAQSIALDSAGNVYIGGTTSSAATFTEPANTKQAGTEASDFFIAKIKINPSNPAANQLVYLTFIGGSGTQLGGEIAVDSNGNAAIAGTTTSAEYPVTDGSTLTAGLNGKTVNDAAVTEIDPTGATLLYSTLFGGNGNEATLSSGGIAMDSVGDIYLAMDTQSTNLTVAPAATTTTPGPFSSVYGGGGSDGFLAIFRPGTTPHLYYCTYLGIDAVATVTGVAVDSVQPVGNAYVAGYTSNPTGTLLTTNGFQTTYSGDPSDGFVMKILPSGNGVADLSYGTFLGGGAMDQALAIAVGTGLPGTAYVTGTTQSINFPVTASAFQSSLYRSAEANANAFLAVIGQSSGGMTSLLYSSYLGGQATDVGLSVWFAQNNQIYISGSTTSANFPALDNLQPFSGDQDAFVTEIDPTSAGAASLTFSTPLGGTSAAGASATALAAGIAADTKGNVYIAGATTSGDFLLAGNPQNGLQLTCASCQQSPPLNDVFLVEITPNPAAISSSVSLNTGKLNFGAQPVGSTAIPPQAVAVYNTGDAPLSISNITLAGTNSADFSLQGVATCLGALIPPGAMCSFEVGFIPSLVGPESTFVTFSDNAPPDSQTLEAVGSGAGPLAVVSPLALSFGNQPEGSVSAPLVITLTNAGNQPLTISKLPPLSGPGSAQFSKVETAASCVAVTLAPGASCELSFEFAPTTTGTFTAEVEFVDNSSFLPNAEQLVTITGTGTGVAPIISILPAALSFPMQPIGITSTTQPLTLTNTGSAAMNLSGIVITGNSSTNFGFVLKGTSACPYPTGPLPAGASCTISVDFTPQASGPISATLSISDNAAGSPQSVALSGSGNGGTYGISLSPTSLNFATQTVGAKSTMQTVTLTNSGTFATALTIARVGANSGDFAETDNCSQSPLAGGKTCVITVTFDPTQTGSRSAAVQISDAAPKSPQIVTLTGSAVQATATVGPSPIAFGNTLAGTASPPVTVTIANTGIAPAVLSVGIPSVNPPGNFTTVNNCTAGVPAAGSCTLAVTFTPPAVPATGACGSTAGAKTATLTIPDNTPTSPQSIALSGASMDYCLAPSGVATQTITAGTPATFQLIADSVQSFAGTVALTCADAASVSTCTVQPVTANLTSGAQVPIVLSVATATNAATPFGRAPDVRRFNLDWPDLAALHWQGIARLLFALFLLLAACASAAKRQPARGMRLAQTGAIAVLLSIGLAACFGGGTGTVAPAGTPTGTYTMTVTGTFTGAGGSTTRSVQVTLIVQ